MVFPSPTNKEADASEPLESTSKAPAAKVAASSCLRRAAALAGLGWSYGVEKQQPQCDPLCRLDH